MGTYGRSRGTVLSRGGNVVDCGTLLREDLVFGWRRIVVDESQQTCSGGRVVERNRYFDGKLMTADDFAAEQAYFLDRSRAHNRLHGSGTVCGLAVAPTDPPSGAVVVAPGVAIDRCGREVILAESVVVDVGAIAATPTDGDKVFLTVRYHEEGIAPAPALAGHEGESTEPGRLREVPRFEVVGEPPHDVATAHKRGRVGGVAPRPACVEPVVTLAGIDLSKGGPLTLDQIDNTVRGYVSLGSSHEDPAAGMTGGEDALRRVSRLERRIKALWGGTAGLMAIAAWLLLRRH